MSCNPLTSMEIVPMRGSEKRRGDFISEAVFSMIPQNHRFRRPREPLNRDEPAAGQAHPNRKCACGYRSEDRDKNRQSETTAIVTWSSGSML